jgi:tetratricopeptide (TPR) repeat protein
MSSKVVIALVQVVACSICLLLGVLQSWAAEYCEEPVGTLVSVQGGAQVQRAGQLTWQNVAVNAEFCPGDMLTIHSSGRAAVVLANETILRLDQKSTITFTTSSSEKFSVIELLRGVLHLFSHRPRSLKVITPYVNGVVEGTEFLVQVETDTSVITVFQGRVEAVNAQGRLVLEDGQSAMARRGVAPVYRAVVRPRDAVAWTLYYPAIIETPVTPESEAAEALRRATIELSTGRVDVARTILTETLRQDQENPEALALLAMIETVQNNSAAALDLAGRALAAAPDSAAAGLALSYAHQSRFDIAAALMVLQKTAEANPENGLLKARLAELLLATGELDKAETAALEAVSLNPAAGLSYTVLGFVYLSRMEIDQAKEAFLQAIERDQVLPLARLGLGLARIRMGQLAAGRADIEIAAALDPGDALIRSYLGKAYFAEKRDGSAGRQYEIAKELDPADPTPWFYDAIRKQIMNRPVEALRDLQQSMERNDNRAVYRSRLLLDGDHATRGASLGRIYTDLGFAQRARVEGVLSLQQDPGNYSAHRFLADSYIALPYHEVSRVSELLQSQLLQPINISPVQPRLAETNLLIVEGGGPAAVSFNEYNPLFLYDRITLQAGITGGNNDTFGDELVLSGVQGRFSYSIGQQHYETEGIRVNNDQELDIYNIFVQGMLSPDTTVLAEIRSRDKSYGDLNFEFDPDSFSNTLRQTDEMESARLGIRHDIRPNSTLLGTAILSTDDAFASTGGDGFSLSVDFTSEVDSHMAEVQHIFLGENFNLRSGAGYLDGEEDFLTRITFPFQSTDETSSSADHFNIYSYAQIYLPHELMATIGFSGDRLESSRKDRSEFNPKLGLSWQPLPSTTVRTAAFKTVARKFIHAQTIEPTMVAGFNQYFDDGDATDYWTYGIGVDHILSSDILAGAQYYQRDLEVPYEFINTLGQLATEEDDWQEDIGSAYIYWAATNWMTAGLEYYYEDISHDNFEGRGGFRRLKTHGVTPRLQLFHPTGVSAWLSGNYINQEGEFGTSFTGYEQDSDRFWTVDIGLSYRLPKRYGIARIAVKNLFDTQFRFVDTDPMSPKILPVQQIVGSLTVVF